MDGKNRFWHYTYITQAANNVNPIERNRIEMKNDANTNTTKPISLQLTTLYFLVKTDNYYEHNLKQ